MNRIQLSQNFYLDEFTRSQTAARHGIEIVVAPDSQVFHNLKRLCIEVLQPIRDALGPISISSGYRPAEVNRLIGGSKTSVHVLGLAADFTVAGKTPYEVAQWIAENNGSRTPYRKPLWFDQCIHEFGRWVHIGLVDTDKVPRRQLLTAYKRRSRLPLKRPKTIYIPGIHRIQDLQKD